uniref:Uncharacterized protein n=1 Tax=Pseudomonas phage HRDY3 TaxID=3236930 RepID=A0AB39CEG5_9VIRU
MTISRAKLDEIEQDEENLNRFIELLERGYTYLSAKCQYAMGGIQDQEPDDDEEEESEAEFDIEKDMSSKELMILKQEVLADFDRTNFAMDDNEYFEDSNVEQGIDPDNENEPKKRREKVEIQIKELYRMIKQLSHPDKLMRYSAEAKQKIIAIFHESTEFMDDDNLEALVFCYVKLRIARNEPHKIPEYIEHYVRERHRQILRHMGFLREKPFTEAILEWHHGNEEWAIILFRQYLRDKKRQDEMEKQAAADDDEFFS